VLQRKQFYLACFVGHFFLIFAVCSRDTLSVIARGYTFFPASLGAYSERAEAIVSTALGERLAPSNPVRQAVSIYTHLGGIAAGYGFFAPNVPDNYKLVFEVHYADGRVEYELPQVVGESAGFRLATLVDNIGETRYDALRQVMIKMVAYSVWREHPDAAMIRAVLGFVILPTAAEFQRGTRESYQYLYSYDFRFSASQDKAKSP
jgi:hypothetical protein